MKNNIKRTIGIMALLLMAMTSTLFASAADFYPKYETRAVWLTTIGGLDWPHSYSQSPRSAEKQKGELIAILDKLATANINTVLLQTRVRATTIYPSSIEPWDGCLSGIPGTSPGYDALQFAIDECHKRGMEVHAWVVAIPIGTWNGLGCKSLRKSHPRLVRKIGGEGYMNPEKPETATYIANICKEIVTRYDVDGIHLDYIRYPETWNINISKTLAREYITRIVRAVNHEVKTVKPWVKMSCSPIGKYDDLTRFWSHGWNAYSRTCQEAQAWLRLGLMDQLFPMMYFRGDQFYPFALDWTEHCYGKDIVAGLGAYMLSANEGNWSIDEIERQMAFARSIGMGQAMFRSKFFTDNIKGIYDYAKNIAYPYPALIPPMASNNSKPAAPTKLVATRKGLDYELQWKGELKKYGEPNILYNVYASADSIVDINNPANLVAVRYAGNCITVSNGLRMRSFAVTAINRYGYESEPIRWRTKGKTTRRGSR